MLISSTVMFKVVSKFVFSAFFLPVVGNLGGFILEAVHVALLVEKFLVKVDLVSDDLEELLASLLELGDLLAVEDERRALIVDLGVELSGENESADELFDGGERELESGLSLSKREGLIATLVVEDEALESRLLNLIQKHSFGLFSILNLRPEIQPQNQLIASSPVALEKLIGSHIDHVVGVLWLAKELLLVILVAHSPEVLAQLVHMRGVLVVSEALHFHKHDDYPMSLLDDLLVHVHVKREEEVFSGSGVTDPGLSEHLLKLEVVENLRNKLEALLHLSKPERTLTDTHNRPVVQLLELLILRHIRIHNSGGIEHQVSRHVVPVMNRMVLNLVVHRKQDEFLVSGVMDDAANRLNLRLSVLSLEKLS